MKKECCKKFDGKCLAVIFAVIGTVAFIAGIAVLAVKLLQNRKNHCDDFCDDDFCDENGCHFCNEDDFEEETENI